MNYSQSNNPEYRPKILIVDDEIAIARMVKEFLTDKGFDPIICSDSEETFRYVKKYHIDLILLDVVMPGMTGMEVAQKLRAEIGRFIPIIMVSAMSHEQDKVIGLQYADDYVTKPFSQDELFARIKALLRISQLQNELLKSKTRYQCLYENIPELCISLTKNHLISDCNSVFCKSFGVKKEDIIGSTLLPFFHQEEHPILNSFFASLHPQKIVDHQHIFKMHRLQKKKKPLYVSLQAVCLGEEEEGLHIIVAMKDVSISVNLEKQQKLARQQLYRSARLASIGTLASGTAHEMNNPLTAILGFSDALLHRFKEGETVDTEEVIEYLSIIKSETLRCRDVVENLSKFSRVYKSNKEKMPLFECLHSVVKLMNVRAQKKNISLINNVGSHIIINTDTHKISQVLVNILSNSIDFCDSGSTVTINAENHEGTSPLRIIIKDTGPGIPEEILPKIFDPFFTTKEVGQGIGLGMSISHKLIEECQGTIDVTSVINEGTTVTLEIPRD